MYFETFLILFRNKMTYWYRRSRFLFTLCNILLILKNQMNSNKDILDKAIGRPAMMAFMILVGTYVTTGQLIPGVF